MDIRKITTIATYTLSKALELLDTPKTDIMLHGYLVSTRSQRYTLFRANPICVGCGVAGNIMKLQTHNPNNERAHFNLFGPTDKGIILLTKDHIMPRAWGGPDHQWNYQTMCATCQQRKSSGLPATSRFSRCHKRYSAEEIEQEVFLWSRFGPTPPKRK